MSCLYEGINFSVQTWLISHAETRRAITLPIFFISTQQSTATDRYSLSYGPAKLDDAMACFEVKTRRAITSSILLR